VSKALLPPLDCHAHIAPDVTPPQLAALGDVVVFAVTRSLDEAESVADRTDTRLVWGCGVHPGVPSATGAYDSRRLARLVPRFALIGEIGMDRRTGQRVDQARVFRSILRAISDEPVLLSIHSAGCVDEVLEVLAERPHLGAILHWFVGETDAVRRAVQLGCFFSVNAGMTDDALSSIPLDRMLPETDFPAARRSGGGRRPGDIESLEDRVANLTGEPVNSLRNRWYRNLRSIATASGALDRVPDALFDALLSA
jgi:TatD DNase family protein